jgi:hypothetical protein
MQACHQMRATIRTTSRTAIDVTHGGYPYRRTYAHTRQARSSEELRLALCIRRGISDRRQSEFGKAASGMAPTPALSRGLERLRAPCAGWSPCAGAGAGGGRVAPSQDGAAAHAACSAWWDPWLHSEEQNAIIARIRMPSIRIPDSGVGWWVAHPGHGGARAGGALCGHTGPPSPRAFGSKAGQRARAAGALGGPCLGSRPQGRSGGAVGLVDQDSQPGSSGEFLIQCLGSRAVSWSIWCFIPVR